MAFYLKGKEVDRLGHQNDVTDQLYAYVLETEDPQEDLCKTALFGQSPHKTRYYNQSKQRLRHRLVNAFLTLKLGKNYWDIYLSTRKKLVVGEAMGIRGQFTLAQRLLEEVHQLSMKYHFSDLLQASAKGLMSYAAVSGETGKFNRYAAREQAAAQQLAAERLAERYFYHLAYAIKKFKPNEEIIDQAEGYLVDLEALNVNTYHFRIFAGNIACILYELSNQIEKLVAVCESSLAFFLGLSFQPPERSIRSFTLNLIPAYIQGEQLDKASAAIQSLSAQYLSPHNLASVGIYQAIIGFRQQDLALTQKAVRSLKKAKIKAAKEELRILEAYLHILSDAQYPFKVGKFLNETPIYSADKKGMNTNIWIIQILMLLKNRKLSPIIDRMESLRSYAYRHLKKDPANRRTDLFIQLLLLLPKYSFDLRVIDEKAGELLQELEASPLFISAIRTELVPYGVLWGKVRGELE